MFTRCTHCDATLRVTAKQLSMARGAVRCGKCSHVFNALSNLSETVPEADTSAEPASRAPATPTPREDVRARSAGETTWSLADEIYRRERTARTQPTQPTPAQQSSGDGRVAPPQTPEVRERPAATPGAPSKETDRLEDSLRDLEKQAREEPDTLSVGAGEDTADATQAQVDDALRRIMPLLDSLGAERSAQTHAPPSEEPPKPAPAVSKPPPEPVPATPMTETPEPAAPKETHHEAHELPRVLQEQVSQRRHAKRGALSRWVYGVLSVLLLMLLAAQYAWFMPDDVVRRYPQARDLVAAFCARAGCELGQSVDTDRLQIASRDVRVHPEYEGALLVTAALVNTAYDVQPYPRIQFLLYDVSGKPIATRVFEPEEYLSTDVAHELGMVPRQPVQIALELLAPEEAAVSFEFKFLP